MFYFPARYFLFRSEIAASKKVPKEVSVCNDYLEIDGIKYAFVNEKNLKICYKAIVIKAMWYQQKDK